MPVFNKMVYNGTEYILGGGGNIGEPLNLTVTSAGLDATIKWEDNEIGTIPPTTFQKSELVRKIGSAPTSPSDGTLVVTETVKDTYKTTGYVDSGLTDGETYYYRVFSYSDLGGISYCDAVSVTPSAGGWQPGVNTLAYYQFNNDLTDSSGNGKNFSGTPYGYTTGVEGNALQNYTPGSAANLTASVAPLGGAFAIAFWISLNNSQTLQRILTFGSDGTTDVQFEFYSGFSGFQIYNNANTTRLAFPFTQPNIGDWHSFVITGDGVNQVELYIDGVQVSPHASYNPTFWYPQNKDIMIGAYGNGAYDNSIDELVIEDKHWVQSDVDAYLANYN